MADPKKRFFTAKYTSSNVQIVANCGTSEEFNRRQGDERRTAVVVEINIGGMVSQTLAETWANQIADQLNQFDVANAVVAKLT